MSRSSLTGCFAMFVVGCYASAPPHPSPVILPTVSDEAVMNVTTQHRTVVETRQAQERSCPADVKDENSPKCTVITRDVTQPVVHVVTTATLGADVINYAQFRVLTDPDYKTKVARLDGLRARCRHADVPRWIGTALMTGGLVTALVGGLAKDGTIAAVGGGAFAGGAGSSLIGYYGFDGDDCNRAWAIYDEVNLRREARWLEADGAELAAEMKVLATQYNAMHRAPADAVGKAGGDAAPAPVSALTGATSGAQTAAPSPAAP